MQNKLNGSIRELSGLHFLCDCGKEHTSDVEDIVLGAGVLPRGVEAIAALGKKALLIADIHTWSCAGERVTDLLSQKITVTTYVFPDEALVPDEYALGRVLMALKPETDLLIAVGSGTINDITRYISAKTGIPYAVVGTAPSMDGYASVVAPLIRGGVKITFQGVYPRLIVADTDIMKKAPERMLAAGFGDVIGKVTALLDWRLSHILYDEYTCEAIMGLVQKAVDRCIENAPALRKRDAGGVEAVTEALLLTGLCIGFAGFSRPASGSEHHLAHYMEMTELKEGKPMEWLHGNHVGMGTGAVLLLYEFLAKQDMAALVKEGRYRDFSLSAWEKRLDAGFGPLSDEIKKNRRDYETDDPVRRDEVMARMVSRWNHVRDEVLHKAMDFNTYRQAMESAGAEWHPRQMGLNKEGFIQMILLAKEIRTRYGILQALEDVGILPEAAAWAADRYYGRETL